MKAGYLTLGCRVNQYETESVAEGLCRLGIEKADFDDVCDIYVINTCAVTEESVRKSKKIIRRAVGHNPDAFVAVMGCAAQLDADALMRIPGVSFVCGTRNKMAVTEAVESYIKGITPEKNAVVPPTGGCERTFVTRFDRARAYVKIEDGCNGKCAYCIIAGLRGEVAVREPEEILSEIRALVKEGCHEVVLTGIETAAYGERLAPLMKQAGGVEGIERIRLGSMEPSFLKPAFIDAVAEIPQAAHHFHLSVQSGCDRTLRAMRRKYNTETLERNMAYIREVLPDVNFSADVIVGFPGETGEDFLATCRFVRRNRFLHLHIFPYSRRPGTEADRMPEQVPEEEKARRLAALSAIADESRHRILEKVIGAGEPLTVLAETYKRGRVYGHTGNFIECAVTGVKKERFDALRGDLLSAVPVCEEKGILVCRYREEI